MSQHDAAFPGSPADVMMSDVPTSANDFLAIDHHDDAVSATSATDSISLPPHHDSAAAADATSSYFVQEEVIEESKEANTEMQLDEKKLDTTEEQTEPQTAQQKEEINQSAPIAVVAPILDVETSASTPASVMATESKQQQQQADETMIIVSGDELPSVSVTTAASEKEEEKLELVMKEDIQLEELQKQEQQQHQPEMTIESATTITPSATHTETDIESDHSAAAAIQSESLITVPHTDEQIDQPSQQQQQSLPPTVVLLNHEDTVMVEKINETTAPVTTQAKEPEAKTGPEDAAPEVVTGDLLVVDQQDASMQLMPPILIEEIAATKVPVDVAHIDPIVTDAVVPSEPSHVSEPNDATVKPLQVDTAMETEESKQQHQAEQTTTVVSIIEVEKEEGQTEAKLDDAQLKKHDDAQPQHHGDDVPMVTATDDSNQPAETLAIVVEEEVKEEDKPAESQDPQEEKQLELMIEPTTTPATTHTTEDITSEHVVAAAHHSQSMVASPRISSQIDPSQPIVVELNHEDTVMEEDAADVEAEVEAEAESEIEPTPALAVIDDEHSMNQSVTADEVDADGDADDGHSVDDFKSRASSSHDEIEPGATTTTTTMHESAEPTQPTPTPTGDSTSAAASAPAVRSDSIISVSHGVDSHVGVEVKEDVVVVAEDTDSPMAVVSQPLKATNEQGTETDVPEPSVSAHEYALLDQRVREYQAQIESLESAAVEQSHQHALAVSEIEKKLQIAADTESHLKQEMKIEKTRFENLVAEFDANQQAATISFQSQLTSARDAVAQLELSYSNQSRELEQTQQRLNETQQQLNLSSQRVVDLTGEVSQLRTQSEDRLSEMTKLQADLSMISTALRNKEATPTQRLIEARDEEIATKQREITEKQALISQQRYRMDEMNEEQKELSLELKKSNKQLRVLEQTTADQEIQLKEIDVLKKELIDMKQAHETTLASMMELRESLKQAEIRATQDRIAADEMDTQFKVSSTTIMKLRSDQDTIMKQLDDAQKESAQLQVKLQAKEQYIETQRVSVDSIQSAIAVYRQQKQKLMEDVKSLKGQVETLKTQHDKDIAKSVDQKEEDTNTIRTLQAKLTLANEELQLLRKQLTNMSEKAESAHEEMLQLLEVERAATLTAKAAADAATATVEALKSSPPTIDHKVNVSRSPSVSAPKSSGKLTTVLTPVVSADEEKSEPPSIPRSLPRRRLSLDLPDEATTAATTTVTDHKTEVDKLVDVLDTTVPESPTPPMATEEELSSTPIPESTLIAPKSATRTKKSPSPPSTTDENGRKTLRPRAKTKAMIEEEEKAEEARQLEAAIAASVASAAMTNSPKLASIKDDKSKSKGGGDKEEKEEKKAVATRKRKSGHDESTDERKEEKDSDDTVASPTKGVATATGSGPPSPAAKNTRGGRGKSVVSTTSNNGDAMEDVDTTPVESKVADVEASMTIGESATKKQRTSARIEKEMEKSKAPQLAENQHPCICFSGFKPADAGNTNPYNSDLLLTLQAGVEKLGGTISKSADFDELVTHCIAPPSCNTQKSLGAALRHRWICHPDWLTLSIAHGAFLSESLTSNCSRYTTDPFAAKKVVFTPEFLKSQARERSDLGQKLVEVGGGSVLSFTPANVENADYILCASLKADGATIESRATLLDWARFMSLIPGYTPSKPRVKSTTTSVASATSAPNSGGGGTKRKASPSPVTDPNDATTTAAAKSKRGKSPSRMVSPSSPSTRTNNKENQQPSASNISATSIAELDSSSRPIASAAKKSKTSGTGMKSSASTASDASEATTSEATPSTNTATSAVKKRGMRSTRH